jgi:competence protein ComEC
MIKINKIKIFTLVIIFSFITFSTFAQDLIVHFIDVGQADSILLELPNGETMLIDAGNNMNSLKVIKYIKTHNINKIDYIIGTHPHEDHIGGIDDVIKTFKIGKIYLPEIIHNNKTSQDLINEIKIKNKKLIIAKKGISIIDEENLKAFILSPISEKYNNLNNWSIVLKVIYGDTSFLFAGDAEKNVEKQLMIAELDITANVLKIGHHGSNTSSSEIFLKAVAPQYAVISAGKNNRYRHPSSIVIKRLQKFGIFVYRTDLQGTIVARSKGNTIGFYNNYLKKDCVITTRKAS